MNQIGLYRRKCKHLKEKNNKFISKTNLMLKIPVRIKSLCWIFARDIENYFTMGTKQLYPTVCLSSHCNSSLHTFWELLD